MSLTCAPELNLNLIAVDEKPTERMSRLLNEGRVLAQAVNDTYAVALLKAMADLLDKHPELNTYL